MPRIDGNCGPVVTATRGVDLPDPDAPRPDFNAIRARSAAPAPAAALALVDVDQAPAGVAGPVVCDVCGVRVAAEYVARTGQSRHKPCQAKTGTTTAVREVA